MSAALPPSGLFPGVVRGDYPQRMPSAQFGAAGASGASAGFDVSSTFEESGPPGAFGELGRTLRGVAAALLPPRPAPYLRFARQVLARAEPPCSVGDEAWRARLDRLRAGAAMHRRWREADLLEAFVLACLAARGRLGIMPYATQIAAARIMLDGRLAEMATGEGKTVAIALAASVAALGATPVHVVTANDYLAARDAQAMRPLYAALGLTVGAVIRTSDTAARRAAWHCDVTCCTAKELVFDYLRDGLSRPGASAGVSDLERRAARLATSQAAPGGGPNGGVPDGGDATSGEPLLRGLCMAIVDEADTVLIDEATVPLVLSRGGGSPALEAPFLLRAAALAAGMRRGAHFELHGMSAALTEAGRALLAQWPPATGLPGAAAPAPPTTALHADPRHREEAVCQALAARHALRRDRDYVLRDGQVVIVDPTTGRASPGRAWSRGLHQFVELKEGCALTARNATAARITYQRFFPRYLRLAGMSGTLDGSLGELRAVYGLATVAVPTRLPSRRITQPLALFASRDALWRAVAERARELRAQGRPVLIGTESVAHSEALSAVLDGAGLAHAVLNARQDAAESEIVARAGEGGRITVATSMAGRGTDIALAEGVAARGGLHVILCQHNASPRIDRQFMGRAGRRGEPGSVQAMLALDGSLMRRWLPPWWRALAGRLACARGEPGMLARGLLVFTLSFAQAMASFTQRQQRQALCRADAQTERALGFNRETFS